MNRRQLAFIILLNALISLAISLAVAWAIDARRPDPEEVAITLQGTGAVAPIVVSTPIVEPPAVTPASTVGVAGAATPTAAVAPTAAISGEVEVYIVQAGDSLGSIAGKYDVSINDLLAVNPELRNNPDLVFSGLPLTIPKPGAAAAATPAPTVAPTELLLEIDRVETPGILPSEAVQLVNNGQREVNLDGWQLRRENGPSYTFGNSSLFPGSGIWLHSRAGDNTSVAFYWGESAPVWASGALVQLVNPEGVVVASYPVP